MTTLPRRSPKLALSYNKDDVRDAVSTLEDRPRIPTKTPASSTADGYDGEICQDANYVYFYNKDDSPPWSRIARSW